MWHIFKRLNTNRYRLLALLIVFFFLSFDFLCNDIQKADNEPLRNQSVFASTLNNNVCTIPNIISVEELLISNAVRIVRCFHRSKVFYNDLNCYLLFIIAAYILYVFTKSADNLRVDSKKIIIKYIHDQDGHKNESFVCWGKINSSFCEQFNNTTEVL